MQIDIKIILKNKDFLRQVNKMKNTIFWTFGSPSSQDADILVIVSDLSNIQNNKSTVKSFEEYIKEAFGIDKELNVNLATLEEGQIKEVFKGTVDEVNNSIIDTYKHHRQHHELVITTRITRDVELKVIRTLRVLLSLISRTDFRKDVKKALKADALEKYKLLEKIDYSQIMDLNKESIKEVDYFKTMAFQLGQTIALLNGVELSTKEDIAEQYPALQDLLMREKSHNARDTIEEYKKKLLSKINQDSLLGKHEILKK